jgi:hypothetical protein
VFDDVPVSDPFCGFVTWIAARRLGRVRGHRRQPPAVLPNGKRDAASDGRLHQPCGDAAQFGVDNTSLAVGVGNFTMTGAHSTAFDRFALPLNASGFSNTALGYSALEQHDPREQHGWRNRRARWQHLPDTVNVVIDTSGRLGEISSSRETKDDIADMRHASAAPMQLRPVTFQYKTHAQIRPAGGLKHGLVADEAVEVTRPGGDREDGKTETVKYQYVR